MQVDMNRCTCRLPRSWNPVSCIIGTEVKFEAAVIRIPGSRQPCQLVRQLDYVPHLNQVALVRLAILVSL